MKQYGATVHKGPYVVRHGWVAAYDYHGMSYAAIIMDFRGMVVAPGVGRADRMCP
jgi:hypothetical protein